MPLRPRQRLQYYVERFLIRGAHYRLIFTAMLVGIVSLGAGALAWRLDGAFDDLPQATWWAFLRLTDPGYLGDDEGIARRSISTVVTLTGYVLFLGSLVAIMTQWLTSTMRNLERGFTPVARRDHILVLGWTNRTPPILQQLCRSRGRARRFLERIGARRLVIVVLVEDVSAELVQTVKDALGSAWDPRSIILRSGSALQVEHLHRVAYADAAAVIVPGADFAYGDPRDSDAHVIKTILTISRFGRDGDRSLPLLTAELFDTGKLHVARRAYGEQIEILPSHLLVARLMAQVIRHVHVWKVIEELLTGGTGNAIYIRPCGELAGHSFSEASTAFPEAILLGFVRPSGGSFSPLLNPDDDVRVDEQASAVLIARSFEATDPVTPVGQPTRATIPETAADDSADKRRVLLLGWNAKAPALLQELASHEQESFDIDVLAMAPADEREAEVATQLARTGSSMTHHVGDFTVEADLASVRPAEFDSILILASDTGGTSELADAHTITGHLVLSDLVAEHDSPPRILVEILDPINARLLGPSSQYLVSPVVLSHMLAQVALRRELRSVYDELFGTGGAEIDSRILSDYVERAEEISFVELRQLARHRGEIAIGIVHEDGRTELNPPAGVRWPTSTLQALIVIDSA